MMSGKDMRDRVAEIDEDMLVADGLDEAIIGVARRAGGSYVVVYDEDMCLDVFMEDGMSLDEAREWFEFNVVSAYVGEQTPIFLSRLE